MSFIIKNQLKELRNYNHKLFLYFVFYTKLLLPSNRHLLRSLKEVRILYMLSPQ